MPAITTGDGVPTPTWTWSDSWWLELRAVGWLLIATLPIAIVTAMMGDVVASGLYDEDWSTVVLGSIATALIVDMLGAGAAAAAAVVALPITHLVGRAMRPVRSRRLHIVVTASLASVLTMVPVAFDARSAVVCVPLGLAAGAAGALARRSEFRRADRIAKHEATDRLRGAHA